MKRAFNFSIFLVFILAFAVFFVCCGGGAGGAAAAGKAKGSSGEEKTNKVVQINQVSNKELGDITYTGGSPVVISSSTTSADTGIQVSVANNNNKKATGVGIYSEWLRGKIANIELIVSVDGVQQTYTLSENETLQLNDIHVGSKIEILNGSKINLKDGKSKNIIPKTYTVEGNSSQKLPVFVEYTATFKSSSLNTTATYTSDSAIQLPILDNATFVGWQIEAPGLEIDGNYYAKGNIVPAGEVCGDITFVADFAPQPLCVQSDATSTVFAVNKGKIDLMQGLSYLICYEDSTPMGYNDTRISSISVSNASLVTVNIDKSISVKMPGVTNLKVVMESDFGKLINMTVPLDISEIEYTEATYDSITNFYATTEKQFEQILTLLNSKNFYNKTIKLERNFTLPKNFTPINTAFRGTLDGNGKMLEGKVIGGGLFKTLGDYFTVKDLTLSLDVISSSDSNIGILASYADTSGGEINGVTIKNSSITVAQPFGSSTEIQVGGLIGKVEDVGSFKYSPDIKNCNVQNMRYEINTTATTIYLGGFIGNSGSTGMRVDSNSTATGNATITATSATVIAGKHLGEASGTGTAGIGAASSMTYTLNGTTTTATNYYN